MAGMSAQASLGIQSSIYKPYIYHMHVYVHRLENINTGAILINDVCSDTFGETLLRRLNTEFEKYEEYNVILKEHKPIGNPSRYQQPQTVEYDQKKNKRTLWFNFIIYDFSNKNKKIQITNHGLIDNDCVYNTLMPVFNDVKVIEDAYLKNGGNDVVSLQCQLYLPAKTANANRLNKHRDTVRLGERGFRVLTVINAQEICFVGRNRHMFIRLLKPKNSLLIIPPRSMLAVQYEHFLPLSQLESLSIIGRTIHGLPNNVFEE
eukprot:859845_1